MHEHITGYPLCWPPGKARTSEPRRSRFGTNAWSNQKRITLNRAVRELIRELDALGATNEIISSNLRLRQDGLPYSNQRIPADPGIAVYFELPDASGAYRNVCMTCDRWDKQACNIWSVAKCVGALRGLERWGGGDMVTAAFTGFVALPAPEMEPWWSVLGFYSQDDALVLGDFEIKAKKLLQQYHPDRESGDEWLFKQVMKAREIGRKLTKAKNSQ